MTYGLREPLLAFDECGGTTIKICIKLSWPFREPRRFCTVCRSAWREWFAPPSHATLQVDALIDSEDHVLVVVYEPNVSALTSKVFITAERIQ